MSQAHVENHVPLGVLETREFTGALKKDDDWRFLLYFSFVAIFRFKKNKQKLKQFFNWSINQ